MKKRFIEFILDVIIWVIAMLAILSNMALENEISRLEDENFKLFAEVQDLKEVIDSEYRSQEE